MALIQIVLVILQGYIGQENQTIIVSHFSWVPLQNYDKVISLKGPGATSYTPIL
jgi:hypothetical protein